MTFEPGKILTAADLNAALANYVPIASLAATASGQGGSLVGLSSGDTVQAFLVKLMGTNGAGIIGAAGGGSVQAFFNMLMSSSGATAIGYGTSTVKAALDATSISISDLGSRASFLKTYPSALPFEVLQITGGGGTGGSPGTYIGGTTGAFDGFTWSVFVGSDGKAVPRIDTPGISTNNTAPTLIMPTIPGLTGATTPVAVVGTIPVNRLFMSPSNDGNQRIGWINSAGSLSPYLMAGVQYSEYLKAGVDTAIASVNARLNFFSVAGGEYAATFGKPFGPILLGFVDATGHADFSGVRTLPIAARDGTIVANIAGSTKRDGFLFYAYDTISRALLFGLQNDGTFVANFNVPEVTTARGTAADLNTRLSRGLTAAGSPKTGTQNVGRLAALRSALTYLKNGGSALVHIMLDGDSWWDAKTYGSTDAITRFFADSGLTNAGPGWIGLASGLAAGTAIHGAAQNNITVTRSGTWNDLFHSTDIPAGTPQNFPGYDAVQSGADGSIYTLVGSAINNCTSLTLFCGKGGTVEQSWDGGTTWTSVTVAAGSGSTTATISMTGKTNTLKLRCTSGTVIAGLFGLSAASGVVFSNFSSSGSTAAQHASVQSNADYKAMMAALPGDALVALIQLGLNDTKAGTANATIVTNVAAVAAGYKAVFTGLPPCDIVLLCQPNTPLSVQDTLAPLLRSCAEDIGAAFVDWQLYFGMPAYSGDYSSYGRDYTSGAVSTALPLLEVESGYRHPSPISRLTAAGKSAAVTGSGVVASTLSNLLLSPTRSN